MMMPQGEGSKKGMNRLWSPIQLPLILVATPAIIKDYVCKIVKLGLNIYINMIIIMITVSSCSGSSEDN